MDGEAVDLAGRQPGQRLEKYEPGGPGEARQLLGAIVADPVDKSLAGSADHGGANFGGRAFLDGGGGGRRHAGAFGEDLLDLLQLETVTAHLDLQVAAAKEDEVSGPIPTRQVSGSEAVRIAVQAGGARGFGVAPVAVEQNRALDANLARSPAPTSRPCPFSRLSLKTP